ncbi:MAG: hypothetical protein ACQETL_01345 [Bacteroidota bacterium]
MKFLIILFSLIIFQTEYKHTAQNKDFIIKYNFVERDGKTYMHGHITFKKNNKNGINTNLGVVGHRIGTVPDVSDGTFKLELPDKKGEILVFNSKYKDKWKFEYKVELSQDKDFTIGDN